MSLHNVTMDMPSLISPIPMACIRPSPSLIPLIHPSKYIHTMTSTSTPLPPSPLRLHAHPLLLPEVLLRIGAYLSPWIPTEYNLPRFWPQDLAPCLLVCRDWHRILTPVLWQVYNDTSMHMLPLELVRKNSIHFRILELVPHIPGYYQCENLQRLLVAYWDLNRVEYQEYRDADQLEEDQLNEAFFREIGSAQTVEPPRRYTLSKALTGEDHWLALLVMANPRLSTLILQSRTGLPLQEVDYKVLGTLRHLEIVQLNELELDTRQLLTFLKGNSCLRTVELRFLEGLVHPRDITFATATTRDDDDGQPWWIVPSVKIVSLDVPIKDIAGRIPTSGPNLLQCFPNIKELQLFGNPLDSVGSMYDIGTICQTLLEGCCPKLEHLYYSAPFALHYCGDGCMEDREVGKLIRAAAGNHSKKQALATKHGSPTPSPVSLKEIDLDLWDYGPELAAALVGYHGSTLEILKLRQYQTRAPTDQLAELQNAEKILRGCTALREVVIHFCYYAEDTDSEHYLNARLGRLMGRQGGPLGGGFFSKEPWACRQLEKLEFVLDRDFGVLKGEVEMDTIGGWMVPVPKDPMQCGLFEWGFLYSWLKDQVEILSGLQEFSLDGVKLTRVSQ